jgi:hypothetical protein
LPAPAFLMRAVGRDFMATKSGGHPGTWAKKGVRTALGEQLINLVIEITKARGLARPTRQVFEEIKTKPPFDHWDTAKQLRDGYDIAMKALPRPPDPRDQVISELQKFGMSPDASVALTCRLIEICTVKIPLLGLDYVFRMIGHVKRVRKLRTGESRAQWFERAAKMLDNPKPRFPIRPWDEASNANIEATKSALHDGLTAIDEIAARTGIKHRTQQELLCFMNNIGEARRLDHGLYGPPQEGVADYVRPSDLVLKALESGPASPEEVRLRVAAAGHHLTEEQVSAALHWLWKKAKKIRRPEPNLYSLPGPGVTDYVFAHDAIVLALRSGKKSMPELIESTRKNRGALQRALRHRLFPEGLVDLVGYRAGYEVRPGFRGRVGVYALTAKGRRLAQQRQ